MGKRWSRLRQEVRALAKIAKVRKKRRSVQTGELEYKPRYEAPIWKAASDWEDKSVDQGKFMAG